MATSAVLSATLDVLACSTVSLAEVLYPKVMERALKDGPEVSAFRDNWSLVSMLVMGRLPPTAGPR